MKLRRGLTLDSHIADVIEDLDRFRETPAYDSGVRRHCTEAYLEGLLDAQRLNARVREAEQ